VFWRRKRSADDFREEIRAHLGLEEDELKAEGWKEGEARTEARKAFGNVTRAEERFYERRRVVWVDDLLRDVRYGFATMKRTPGFTLATVLTLTLGIGGNTTIFSFVNALLLRPLPVRDLNRLVALYTSDYSGPAYGGSSYPDYLEFRENNSIFSGMAAYAMRQMNLSTGGATERVLGHVVTEDYFPVLGVGVVQGRAVTAEDETRAVLSYNLWQRSFASDRDVVGRRIVLNGKPYHVAGVAAQGFTGVIRGIPADLWVPLPRNAQPGSPEAAQLTSRGSRWLLVAGRLAEGVGLTKAQAAFRVVASRLHKAYPENWTDIAKQGRRITLQPVNEALLVDRGGVVRFLTVLMAVVGIVLLLACVNVANLLLARAAARTREMSIRLSLGAGRSRLIRQLLTESVLLSAVAGVAGVLGAIWATRLMMGFRPPLPLPVVLDLSLDVRVLGFAIALSVATALAFGLLPAIRATRPDLTSALKEAVPEAGSRGVRVLTLRNTLAIAQVALSLLLLVGAGLFIRSLLTASAIDVGFDRKNLVVASLDLGLQGYDEARGMAFYRQLLERMETLPGVRSASLAEIVPLGFGGQRTGVELEGYTPRQGEDMELNFNVVSPRYFLTMGIPLVRGREFAAQDRDKEPGVVIVNEALARRYWPGSNPLGKHIRRGRANYTVVGVASDGKYRSLGEPSLPYFYLSLFQDYSSGMSIHVRTHGEPAVMVSAIRSEVRALDKDLPLTDVKTMEEHLGLALLPSRVAGMLLGAFWRAGAGAGGSGDLRRPIIRGEPTDARGGDTHGARSAHE
jgi:predicted permease